ncbi:unnamed protein product, partial [Ectocarpus sp. 12 AP-2014]
ETVFGGKRTRSRMEAGLPGTSYRVLEEYSMREDLPYEEPRPALWSLSLEPGGGTIDEGPHPVLEFAVVQPLLQLGDDHALWQV